MVDKQIFWKPCVCSFIILSCPAFNSAFVDNFASFVFESESFARLEIVDSLTNFFVLSLNRVFSFSIIISYFHQFTNITNFILDFSDFCIKGALSCLTQFFATETPLKMIKNTFYVTLQTLSVLKTWFPDDCNTDIINISRSKGNQAMKFGHVNMTWETFFLKNHSQNLVENLFPDLFLKYQKWAYLWINCLKFYAVFFFIIVCQAEDYRSKSYLPSTCF